MDLEISDDFLGTFVPIVVYWVYSGNYILLVGVLWELPVALQERWGREELGVKGTVVKGVLLQQTIQAIVAILLFKVSVLKNCFFFGLLWNDYWILSFWVNYAKNIGSIGLLDGNETFNWVLFLFLNDFFFL